MTNPNVNENLNKHLDSELKNTSKSVTKISNEVKKFEEIPDVIVKETVAKCLNSPQTTETLCKNVKDQSEKYEKCKTLSPIYNAKGDSSASSIKKQPSSNISLRNSASTLSSQCSVIEKITVCRGNVSESLAVTLHKSCENISKKENTTVQTTNEVVKIGKASSATANPPEKFIPKMQQTESHVKKKRSHHPVKLAGKRNHSFTSKPSQGKILSLDSSKAIIASEISKTNPRRKSGKYHITYNEITLNMDKRKIGGPAMIVYKPYLPLKIRILQKLFPKLKEKLFNVCVKECVKDELKTGSDKNSLDVKCSTGSSTALRRAADVRSLSSTFYCEAKQKCIKSTVSLMSISQSFLPIDGDSDKKKYDEDSKVDFLQKPDIKKPSRTNKPTNINDTVRKETQLDSKPVVTKQNQNDTKHIQMRRSINGPEKDRVSSKSEIKYTNKMSRLNAQSSKVYPFEKKRGAIDNDLSSCEQLPVRKSLGNSTKLNKNLEIDCRRPHSDKAPPFPKKIPLRKKMQQITNQDMDSKSLSEHSQQIHQPVRKNYSSIKSKYARSPEKPIPKATLEVDSEIIKVEKVLDLNIRKPVKEILRKNKELIIKCSPTDRKQPKHITFDTKVESYSNSQLPDDTTLNIKTEPDLIRLSTRKYTRATSAPSHTKLYLSETLHASKRSEIRNIGKFSPAYSRSYSKVTKVPSSHCKIKRTIKSESDSINYFSNKYLYRNSRSPTREPRNSRSLTREEKSSRSPTREERCSRSPTREQRNSLSPTREYNKSSRSPTREYNKSSRSPTREYNKSIREHKNSRSPTREQNSKTHQLPFNQKISKIPCSKKNLCTKNNRFATEFSPISNQALINIQRESIGDYFEKIPKKGKVTPAEAYSSNKQEFVNDIYSNSCLPTIMRLSANNVPLPLFDLKANSAYEKFELSNKKCTVREYNKMMSPILEMDNTQYDEMCVQTDKETLPSEKHYNEQIVSELSQTGQSDNDPSEYDKYENGLLTKEVLDSEQSDYELVATEHTESEHTESDLYLGRPNVNFHKSHKQRQALFCFTDEENILKPVNNDPNDINAFNGEKCGRFENILSETESERLELATIQGPNWSSILNFEKKRYLDLQLGNIEDRFKLPRCALDSNKSLVLKKQEYNRLDPSSSEEMLFYERPLDNLSGYAALSFGGTVPIYWNSFPGKKQHDLRFMSDFYEDIWNQNQEHCQQFSKKQHRLKINRTLAEYRKIRHVKMGKYKRRQVKALLEQIIKQIEIQQVKGYSYSKKGMLGRFLFGGRCYPENAVDKRNSYCDCPDIFNKGVYCEIVLEFIVMVGCLSLFILLNLMV